MPEELVKLRKQNSDPAMIKRRRRRLERDELLAVIGGYASESNGSHSDIPSDLQRVFQRVVHHRVYGSPWRLGRTNTRL